MTYENNSCLTKCVNLSLRVLRDYLDLVIHPFTQTFGSRSGGKPICGTIRNNPI